MNRTILKKGKEKIPLPELYELYSADIFRYSYSILRESDDAKDAVQETFVRYFENENSFRGDCSQKTWLFTIARNYCYNKLKNKSRGNQRIDTDEDNHGEIHEEDLERRISLEAALLKISAEHNELLCLKEYERYSYKEIAEITEQSVENVKIKLFRAREHLRKILKDDR